ncbi:hypothetical protein [Cytobacillus gottheilii]|uniref:hypothetical protein n=1 Tax=Cytobacillus gottheilii TaxID=859144 RepID=UPI002494AFCA|nr:hypothetical protein [Cytobacillus gottheilii]
MSVLDKEKVDLEYTEAIQELQSLYDDLFYEELKGKINEILLDFRDNQHNLEDKLKKSADASNGFLRVIQEDLEKHITQKHNDTLTNISNWIQQLNKFTNTRFDQQTLLVEEQMKQEQKGRESSIQAFDQWKDQLSKRLDKDIATIEKHADNLVEQVNASKETLSGIVTSSQTEIKSRLQTIREDLIHQIKQIEELTLKELEQLQQKEIATREEIEQLRQKIIDMNEQSESRIDTLSKNVEKKLDKNKTLLFSIVGTQVGVIILGLVAYFS